MTFNAQYSGSFTSSATPDRVDVELPQGQPDLFVLKNRTRWNTASTTGIISEWRKGMSFDAALSQDLDGSRQFQTPASAISSGGFRFIDEMNPPTFSANTISAISNANPAVATVDSSTGSINVGDIVRVTNSTGMLQISGYDFSVTAVSTNTSVTLNFDAQNEAAAATDGEIRLIIPNRFYPRNRYIVPVGGLEGIDQASQCVVCTSVYHNFTVGEKVRLKVSSDYGMSEADGLIATVLSIGNASGAAYSTASAANYNALKLDLNTSGFSAFVLPTSEVFAEGASPAQILPAGAGPESGANPPNVPINAAYDNRSRYIMRCGTSVIAHASNVYDWYAYYSNKHSAE